MKHSIPTNTAILYTVRYV